MSRILTNEKENKNRMGYERIKEAQEEERKLQEERKIPFSNRKTPLFYGLV